jgi:hypothetical protein
LQATVAELDAIGAALAPYRAAVEHLVTIPGGYEVTLRPAA